MSSSYSTQQTSSTPSSTGILGGSGTGTSGTTQRTGTFGQYGHQQAPCEHAGLMGKARDWMQSSIQNSSEFMRRNVNQYPLLAGYLFTLMAMCAIPVSLYTIFGLVSSVVLLTIALLGFAAIEGTILLASGGLLLTVVGTITFFTTLGFGFLGFIWLGYKSFGMVFGRVWEGAEFVTSTMGQKIQEQMPAMGGSGGQQPSQYASGMGGSR